MCAQWMLLQFNTYRTGPSVLIRVWRTCCSPSILKKKTNKRKTWIKINVIGFHPQKKLWQLRLFQNYLCIILTPQPTMATLHFHATSCGWCCWNWQGCSFNLRLFLKIMILICVCCLSLTKSNNHCINYTATRSIYIAANNRWRVVLQQRRCKRIYSLNSVALL